MDVAVMNAETVFVFERYLYAQCSREIEGEIGSVIREGGKSLEESGSIFDIRADALLAKGMPPVVGHQAQAHSGLAVLRPLLSIQLSCDGKPVCDPLFDAELFLEDGDSILGGDEGTANLVEIQIFFLENEF